MDYKYKHYALAHHILKLSSIVIAQIVTFDKRLLHSYVQDRNICRFQTASNHKIQNFVIVMFCRCALELQ
jgi:hypothetical protein